MWALLFSSPKVMCFSGTPAKTSHLSPFPLLVVDGVFRCSRGYNIFRKSRNYHYVSVDKPVTAAT